MCAAVEPDGRRLAVVVAEAYEAVGGAHEYFARRGAVDTAHLLAYVLGIAQTGAAGDELESASVLLDGGESSSVGGYPDAPVLVGHHVVYSVAGQRVAVGGIVGVVVPSSVEHVESLVVGAYPYTAVAVLEEAVDACIGKGNLLGHELTVGGKVSQLVVVAVAHLDNTVEVSVPMASVDGEHDGAHLRLALLQAVERIGMVLEVDLCKVVYARHPQYALVGDGILGDARHTRVARGVALQHIGHELAGLAVVVAERTIVGNYPQRVVLVLHDEEMRTGGTVLGIVHIGVEPLLLHGLGVDECDALPLGECPYHVVVFTYIFLTSDKGWLGFCTLMTSALKLRGLYTITPMLVARSSW